MEVVETPKTNGAAPEDAELQKLYQEYLQKCCEVGQIQYQLDQLDGQKREIEKQLEVTQRARNKAANSHRDLQKAKFSKLKAVPNEEAKLDLKPEPEAAH